MKNFQAFFVFQFPKSSIQQPKGPPFKRGANQSIDNFFRNENVFMYFLLQEEPIRKDCILGKFFKVFLMFLLMQLWFIQSFKGIKKYRTRQKFFRLFIKNIALLGNFCSLKILKSHNSIVLRQRNNLLFNQKIE